MAFQGTLETFYLSSLLQLLSGMIEHTTSLTASIWADPEMARRFEAYIRERMPMGLRGGPVAVAAAYLRAEQACGRVRDDIDPLEAAAVVVSVPFASGMQRVLHQHLPGPGEFPAPGAAALEILARGLEPGAGERSGDA